VLTHGLDTLRSARASVDLSRLDANYRAVAAASGLPLMPVVKADAYGHGAVHVARRLEALGAPLLAVAHVEEGAALRAAGIRGPIVVLAGCEPARLQRALPSRSPSI
jgi:alanine racemase